MLNSTATARVVYSATPEYTYDAFSARNERDEAERQHAQREREYGGLMRQRYSFCG